MGAHSGAMAPKQGIWAESGRCCAHSGAMAPKSWIWPHQRQLLVPQNVRPGLMTPALSLL
ncbi:uncharacterized protein G2W53_027603 [Senna tora]|uniref:Uncharacterized protein n=1 Tax=Senna tora TaxID=362788 RepID=A0A834TH77_9FABA|nr:uncharacterized protein G2W53_027603 [Senna tora]